MSRARTGDTLQDKEEYEVSEWRRLTHGEPSRPACVRQSCHSRRGIPGIIVVCESSSPTPSWLCRFTFSALDLSISPIRHSGRHSPLVRLFQ